MMRQNPNLEPFIKLLNECFIDGEDSFEIFLTGSFLNILSQIPRDKTLEFRITKFIQKIYVNSEIPNLLKKISEEYPKIYTKLQQQYTEDFERYKDDGSETIKNLDRARQETISQPPDDPINKTYEYSSLMVIIHSFTNNFFHVEVGFWNERLENQYLPILTEYGQKQNNLSNIFHKLFHEINDQGNESIFSKIPTQCFEFIRVEIFVTRQFFIQEKELLIQSLSYQRNGETIKLCRKFTVVFRLKERIRDKISGEWQTNWQNLCDYSAQIQHLIPDNLFQISDNNYIINQQNNIGFGLKPLLPNTYDDIFGDISDCGIPIFLWFRHSFQETEITQCLSKIKGIFEETTDLKNLPETIVNLRRQAYRSPNNQNHEGNHICLLWDDPTRIPIILAERGNDENLLQSF